MQSKDSQNNIYNECTGMVGENDVLFFHLTNVDTSKKNNTGSMCKADMK